MRKFTLFIVVQLTSHLSVVAGIGGVVYDSRVYLNKIDRVNFAVQCKRSAGAKKPQLSHLDTITNCDAICAGDGAVINVINGTPNGNLTGNSVGAGIKCILDREATLAGNSYLLHLSAVAKCGVVGGAYLVGLLPVGCRRRRQECHCGECQNCD